MILKQWNNMDRIGPGVSRFGSDLCYDNKIIELRFYSPHYSQIKLSRFFWLSQENYPSYLRSNFVHSTEVDFIGFQNMLFNSTDTAPSVRKPKNSGCGVVKSSKLAQLIKNIAQQVSSSPLDSLPLKNVNNCRSRKKLKQNKFNKTAISWCFLEIQIFINEHIRRFVYFSRNESKISKHLYHN